MVAGAGCGGVVAAFALATGENSDVADASAISGKVRSVRTDGSNSYVTVTLSYRVAPGEAQPTAPATTVKVLTVKRDGGWWVAVPEAFNPVAASHGGLTESQLQSEYRMLLRAAKKQP